MIKIRISQYHFTSPNQASARSRCGTSIFIPNATIHNGKTIIRLHIDNKSTCRIISKNTQIKQSVAVNTVLSAYSVLSLENLLKYFKSLKDTYTDQPLEIWFAHCDYPAFLKPSVLQGKLRQQAINNLTQSINILQGIKSNPTRSIDNLKSLRNDLNDSILSNALSDKFVKYTKDLDQIRNQNFNQTFGTDYEQRKVTTSS